MRSAAQEAGFEQLGCLIRSNRPVTDAAGSRFHFNKRLKPKETARSCAHHLDVEAAPARLIANCVRDTIRANGQR
jgi:hypothetical protein